MILDLIIFGVSLLGGGVLGYRVGKGQWPWRGISFSLLK